MQKLLQFLKEVQEQFKNITWPQKDTLVQLTFVIITISVIISGLLGGLDYLFVNTIGLLSNSQSPPQIQVDQAQPQITPEASQTITPTTPVTPTPNSKK